MGAVLAMIARLWAIFMVIGLVTRLISGPRKSRKTSSAMGKQPSAPRRFDQAGKDIEDAEYNEIKK